jgi:hypothetical protein
MKSRLLSGKVKKLTGTRLDGTRYEYLALGQAEPDLGAPTTDGSVLISLTTGTRIWSNILVVSTLTSSVVINSLIDSNSTTTGALVVKGGVGIGGTITARTLNITTTSYIANAQILTTATVNDFVTVIPNQIYQNTSSVRVIDNLDSGVEPQILITVANRDTVVYYSTLTEFLERPVVIQGRGLSSYTGIPGNSLQVYGGIGAQQLYISGTAYLGGAEILTTQTGLSSELGSILARLTEVLTTTTNAVNTQTGALIVRGGVGIGKDVYIGGTLVFENGGRVVTNQIEVKSTGTNTATNTGVLLINGGIVTVTTTTVSTSSTTGALTVVGGVGIGGNLNVGSTATFGSIGGIVNIISTAVSTSSTTGALRVSGGVGVGGDLYVGGTITANQLTIQYTTITTTIVETDDIIKTFNTTSSTSSDTGALTVAGGVGIGADLYVGGRIYSQTAEVLTTASVNQYANQTTITAGTDTAVNTSTGNIVIWNTSTLQSITDRGNSTTNVVTILNSASRALYVQGGVYIGGDLELKGSLVVTTSSINSYVPSTVINAGTDTAVYKDATTGTNTFYIWNTSTLQSITDRSNSTTNVIRILNTGNSLTTGTGALVVDGGVYVAKDARIDGNLYLKGSLVLTSATLNSYVATTDIRAGTDTAVSSSLSTGSNVFYVWNTSTLQTITDRGNSTTNAINILNASNSALTIAGGVTVGSILNVASTLTFAPVSWNYVPTTFTSIPVTYGQTGLTFTVQPDNTITDIHVAYGNGGYGPGSVGLTIPGTTFPGGTSPANDIIFDVETFESPGPVYSTAINSAVSYVSGTPPQRYDNIYSTGSIGIGAGNQHWVFDTDGKLIAPGNIVVQSTENSVSTTTGALTVTGGLGIGQNANIGGNVQILSTASDTATNVANSLYLAGGLWVERDLTIRGQFSALTATIVQVTGNSGQFFGDIHGFGALYAGIPAGFTELPSTVLQLTADDNNYVQSNFQNINNGPKASTDWVLTSADGANFANFIDMGMTSGTWDGSQEGSIGTIVGANDGYLYVQGNADNPGQGNLVLGTVSTGSEVKIFVAGYGSESLVASFGPANTQSTSTTTGAVVVRGGVGISENVFIGGDLHVVSTSNSTAVNNGAVSILGGIGIVKDLWVGGVIYSGGQAVVTTSTVDAALNQTLQTITDRGFTTTNRIKVINATASTSTDTGALTVFGGVGIGHDLWVGGRIYSDNSQAVTVSTIDQFAASQITAGTDTAVSSSTGVVTIWNTSTLQSITNRGSSTTNAIKILNTLSSTSTIANNALFVNGGVGINGTLLVQGKTVFKDDVLFVGSTVNVYSTNTYYTDNIIELHSPGGGPSVPWTVNDGKDIGFRFHYYDTFTGDQNAALVLDNTTKYLDWYSLGAEDNTGNFSTATFGTFRTGEIVITNSTPTLGTNSGALRVVGGVGIGGDLYVGGNIIGLATTASTFFGTAVAARNIAGGKPNLIPYQSTTSTTNFDDNLRWIPETATLSIGTGNSGTGSITVTQDVTIGNALYVNRIGAIDTSSIYFNARGVYSTATSTSSHYWSFNSDGSTSFPGYKFPTGDGPYGYALVTNGTGTVSWSPVLSYVGSMGFTGSSSGFTGSKGYIGSFGYTGSIGYSGSMGVGYTGSTSGFVGSTGYAGSLGYTGSIGIGYTGSTSGYIGSTGYTGSQGAGYVGSSGSGYVGSMGYSGSQGPRGADGTSVRILGSVATYTALPGYPSSYGGSIGDGYITLDTGHLWVWNGSTWIDAGNITGPQGNLGYSGSQGAGFTGSLGVLGYTGSIGYQGSKGALDPWIKIVANYTAGNNQRLIADTSAGQFTVALPDNPVIGSYLVITDGASWKNIPLLVTAGASTIEGYGDTLVVDIAGITVEFIWSGGTWQVTATLGVRGAFGYTGSNGGFAALGYTGSQASLTSVSSSIIPATSSTYTLGAVNQGWTSVYANFAYIGSYSYVGNETVDTLNVNTTLVINTSTMYLGGNTITINSQGTFLLNGGQVGVSSAQVTALAAAMSVVMGM